MTTLNRVAQGPVRCLPVNPGEGLIRFPDTPPTPHETVAPPLPLDEVLQDFTQCLGAGGGRTPRKRQNLPWPKRIPGTPSGRLPEKERDRPQIVPLVINEM